MQCKPPLSRFLGRCASIYVVVACLAVCESAEFQNLDFEAARVPVIPRGEHGSLVAATNAIPFWTAYFDGSPIPSVDHNPGLLGYWSIALLGPEWMYPYQILDGMFTVRVSGYPGHSFAIGQRAQIPSGAKSLTFTSLIPGDKVNPAITVTFGGNVLRFDRLERKARYDILVADISFYAGVDKELRFTAEDHTRGAYIDNLTFLETFAPPVLSIERRSGTVRVSWPQWCKGEGYTLQSKETFNGEWQEVTTLPLVEESLFVLVIRDLGRAKYYRLRKL